MSEHLSQSNAPPPADPRGSFGEHQPSSGQPSPPPRPSDPNVKSGSATHKSGKADPSPQVREGPGAERPPRRQLQKGG
jgi:hypothetical protein